MQEYSLEDYKHILTQLIQKQIAILGPQIVVMKAKSIEGLVMNDQGVVTDINANPTLILQKLIDTFVSLSGEIVKKTLEPLYGSPATPSSPPPVTLTPSHLDTTVVVNPQSGEIQQHNSPADVQHIIDEAAKGMKAT